LTGLLGQIAIAKAKQLPNKNEKGWITYRQISLRAFFGIYRKQILDRDRLQTPIQWCQKPLYAMSEAGWLRPAKALALRNNY
jgi:hypothetical protein